MTAPTRFPNYMEMRQAVPVQVWNSIRMVTVGVAFGVVLTLFARPDLGLFIIWRLVVPLLPLLFFTAPGIWRNICPLAMMNQAPRLFGQTKAMVAPAWLKDYGYVIGISLFIALVTLRKVVFNTNGAALGALLTVVLFTALGMGLFFKGKSGWCSSICPLLPVQRIYGQTPLLTVPNSHCQPCVGCTKNCYDFNPAVAYLADLNDPDERFAGYRKFFVGMFPGFVLAFYLLPSPTTAGAITGNPLPFCDTAFRPIAPGLPFVDLAPTISVGAMYALFAVFALASAGAFWLVNSFLDVSTVKVTTVFGAAAINIYYWFNAPLIGGVCSADPVEPIVWGLRALVFGLTLVWIVRTYQKEPAYLAQTEQPVSISLSGSLIAHRSANMANPEVYFKDVDARVVVKPGSTLLAVAEANDLPIEAGCRMGVCGADPISVLDGGDALSKVGSDEQSTLERLGLGSNSRMACVAKIKGACTISLSPAEPDVFESSIIAGFDYDRDVSTVVIVGNGIAGVTAADHVRRRHPTCEIHLIGNESHHLYNRMAITRLIYGRSAMEGLYLMPEKWYKDHQVTVWLNTEVTSIDRQAKQVNLGTSEVLDYDKLILTTGSRSWVPSIEGYGLPGSSVLRDAEDAINVRRYAQQPVCRRAVVAGGGLLGLEAAYGLSKVGLDVAVLERGDSLLRRQLDAEGGQYLRSYLEGLGIEIVTNASAVGVDGTDRVESVTLKDGRTLPCDLLLVATGIRSNTGLGASAGVEVGQGIVVDDTMQTSEPDIYAAGDAAEFDGSVVGLWTVAAAQGETAAANAVGSPDAGPARFTPIVPVTMLKVAGIDLTSIGQIERPDGDDGPDGSGDEIVLRDPDNHRYRKLMLDADGKVAGAIVIGFPDEARALGEIVKQDLTISDQSDQLRRGDWSGLESLID